MKKLSTILLGLALSAPAFAQSVIGSTTLSTSISAFVTNVCVASATGIVVPTLGLAGGVLGSYLVVDGEVMRVNGQGTASTCFNVNRGQQATLAQGFASFHGNGAKVWILGQTLSTGDPSRPISTSLFLSQKPYQPFYVASTPLMTVPALTLTTADVANTLKFTTMEEDFNGLYTGACWLNGSTVGTDKRIAFLWDATGTLVANTTLAGTTTSGASALQCVAFTSPVAILGPAQYFLGVAANGTTDTFATYTAGSLPTSFGSGTQTGTTFGNTANLTTVPTAFTAGTPYMSLF